MSLTSSSLSTIPISFASVSIGYKPSHTLPLKLSSIAAAGFTGIELGFPDLVTFASSHLHRHVGPKDFDDLCTAAEAVQALCAAKHLQIMLLQPFANFEGWPDPSPERTDAFERAEGWIRIMLACGCTTLQVGSTDTPLHLLSPSLLIPDLRTLADMLAAHSLRLAYENWCWSSHAPSWRSVFSICRAVARPNFGLCLDTFQTAGGEWGDPTTLSGMLEPPPGGGKTREEVEQRFAESMKELSETVPKEKIYLLQISDAYRLAAPMSADVDGEGLRPRGRWSHDFRPAPFRGGYLPVGEVVKAVLGTGFRGWLSYEVFDAGPDGRGREYEMDEFAREVFASHGKLMAAVVAEE